MTEDQFIALLLFQLPFTLLFMDKVSIIVPIFVNLIVFLILTILAENEFVKDCKKGYNRIDESIFPKWIYKQWLRVD